MSRRQIQRERQEELRKHREYNHRWYAKRKRQLDKAREHRVLVRVQLPDQLVATIHRMVLQTEAFGRYNYHSQREAIEDLIRKGLGWWAEHGDEETSNEMPAIIVSERVEKMARQRRQAQLIVHKLREEVAEMQGTANSETSALQFYKSTMDEVLKMPPTLWRDYAIKELEKEFPKFAKTKRVPGVVLKLSGKKR